MKNAARIYKPVCTEEDVDRAQAALLEAALRRAMCPTREMKDALDAAAVEFHAALAAFAPEPLFMPRESGDAA